MTFEHLKIKLLATDCFEDNLYLDKYCNLIICNEATLKLPWKTQTHHIIPRAYFAKFNLETDDSDENLVNLFYEDHIRAHYYLWKSAKNFLKRSSFWALSFMINTVNRVQSYLVSDDQFELLLKEIRENLNYKECFNFSEDEFKEFYLTHTNIETAKHFNINRNAISDLALVYNVSKNLKRRTKFKINDIDTEEFKEYYLIQNHSLEECAKYFNTSKSSIIRLCDKLNLHKRKTSKQLREVSEELLSKLHQVILNTDWNNLEKAEYLGISPGQLKYLINRYSLENQTRLSKIDRFWDENYIEIVTYYFQTHSLKQTIEHFSTENHILLKKDIRRCIKLYRKNQEMR